MRIRGWWALAFGLGPVGIGGGVAAADGPPDSHKKVLVESYEAGTGAGPSATSAASGQVAAVRHGVDHVVSITFLGPDQADRRRAYDGSSGRDAGPGRATLVVDGRAVPDRARATSAVDRALREVPGIALRGELGGSGRRKVLAVEVEALAAERLDQDLIVGVALTEDRVAAGPEAGRAVVGRHVARRFEVKEIRLGRSGPKALTFPLELPASGDPSGFRVAFFVQDRGVGKVHQAGSLPWVPSPPEARPDPRSLASRAAAKIRARRALDAAFADLLGGGLDLSSGDDGTIPAACPNCGATYTIPGLAVQPGGSKTRNGQPSAIPPVPC